MFRNYIFNNNYNLIIYTKNNESYHKKFDASIYYNKLHLYNIITL